MSRVIVFLAVLPLPAGVRARYRQEFRADLAMLPGRAGLLYSVRVLLGALALRRALSQAGGTTMTEHRHKPLRCRSGYHAWTETHAASGEVHRHCTRCDEDEYDLPTTRSDETNVVGGLVQGFGNASTGG